MGADTLQHKIKSELTQLSPPPSFQPELIEAEEILAKNEKSLQASSLLRSKRRRILKKLIKEKRDLEETLENFKQGLAKEIVDIVPEIKEHHEEQLTNLKSVLQKMSPYEVYLYDRSSIDSAEELQKVFQDLMRAHENGLISSRKYFSLKKSIYKDLKRHQGLSLDILDKYVTYQSLYTYGVKWLEEFDSQYTFSDDENVKKTESDHENVKKTENDHEKVKKTNGVKWLEEFDSQYTFSDDENLKKTENDHEKVKKTKSDYEKLKIIQFRAAEKAVKKVEKIESEILKVVRDVELQELQSVGKSIGKSSKIREFQNLRQKKIREKIQDFKSGRDTSFDWEGLKKYLYLQEIYQQTQPYSSDFESRIKKHIESLQNFPEQEKEYLDISKRSEIFKNKTNIGVQRGYDDEGKKLYSDELYSKDLSDYAERLDIFLKELRSKVDCRLISPKNFLVIKSKIIESAHNFKETLSYLSLNIENNLAEKFCKQIGKNFRKIEEVLNKHKLRSYDKQQEFTPQMIEDLVQDLKIKVLPTKVFYQKLENLCDKLLNKYKNEKDLKSILQVYQDATDLLQNPVVKKLCKNKPWKRFFPNRFKIYQKLQTLYKKTEIPCKEIYLLANDLIQIEANPKNTLRVAKKIQTYLDENYTYLIGKIEKSIKSSKKNPMPLQVLNKIQELLQRAPNRMNAVNQTIKLIKSIKNGVEQLTQNTKKSAVKKQNTIRAKL